MIFRAGRFEFSFPRPALVMGVVNVTPDSFSDGGRFFEAEAAIEHGVKLVRGGAQILDIGGESTRPGAEPVEQKEELRRVLPVIRALAEQVRVPISIDTMKPGVAEAAVEDGASIINDVAASRDTADMWRLVAETGVGYVCMHMQGTPQTMQLNPFYVDVVAEVEAFFRERLAGLERAGVRSERVIFDPGIGFGKTLEHNLQLIGALRRLTKLERPILLGVSRKSFISKVVGADAASRLPAGLACACLAVEAGVQIIRAHDVAETVQAVRMTEAIISKKTE
jgi:dihydropteroate synthase